VYQRPKNPGLVDEPHTWPATPTSPSRPPARPAIPARPIRSRPCIPICARSCLRQIYGAFGPRRLFWGTDISKMPCSWGDCVAMFAAEPPWLARADLPLVMGEAVCAWRGWVRGA